MKYLITHSYPEASPMFTSDEINYVLNNEKKWKIVSFSKIKNNNENIIFIDILSGIVKFLKKDKFMLKFKLFLNCFHFNLREFYVRLNSLFLACDFIYKIEPKNSDFIYSYWLTRPSLIAYYINLLSGIDFVVQGHGSDIYIYPPKLLPKVLDRALKILTIGEKNLEYLKCISPQNSYKMECFKLGSKINSKPKEYKIRENKIIYIGRFEKVKGTLELLKSLKLIKKGLKELGYKVEIYGRGSLDNKMREFIRKNDLKNLVFLKGWINKEDLEKELNKAKLILLPSKSEGLPVILMEAYSCGVPSVSNNVGGVSEIVKDRENGLLNYKIENNLEYSKKIMEFLNFSEIEKENYSKNAYKIAKEEFNLEKNLEKKYYYLNNL